MSKLLNKGGYGIIDLTKYTIPVSTESATKPASPAVIGGVFDYVKKMLGNKKPTVVMGVVTTPAVANIETKSSTKYSLNAIADGYAYSIFVTSDNEVWAYKSALAGGGGGGATELSDLDDVDLNEVANGQILKWNSTTEKWENANESGGGGSADYQIIDVASETLWDDLEALDLTKPVFIKRTNYCVPVILINHYSSSYPYYISFFDGNQYMRTTVTNGTPVTVTTEVVETLNAIIHSYKGGVQSATATIATGEYSEDVTLSGFMGSITTIDGLVGNVTNFNGAIKPYSTGVFVLDVTLTDEDAGLTNYPAEFLISIRNLGNGMVNLQSGECYAYSGYDSKTYKYKVIPNKNDFVIGESTPDALSFTVYRVVTDDDYSTSEVLTNKKWIDGKPVYRKVVSLGALPNNTYKEVDTGLDYATTDLVMIGFCGATNGVSYTPIPFTDPATTDKGIGVWVYKQTPDNEIRIKITTDTDWSTYNGYAIIYFTKVTT